MQELPRAVIFLRPLVNVIARVPASVHTKLRAGFLVGALLLVGMAIVSLAVQRHIADRVSELNVAQDRLDDLRRMDYLVTAQSHYRTMSLLTHDDTNVQSIAEAKSQFLQLLDAIQPSIPDADRGAVARIIEANQRYAISGQHVLELYHAGQFDDALKLHLAEEHPISPKSSRRSVCCSITPSCRWHKVRPPWPRTSACSRHCSWASPPSA